MGNESISGERGRRGERVEILGVPVDMISLDDAMKSFMLLMVKELRPYNYKEPCAYIVTPNSEIIWSASRHDIVLKEIIEDADLIIPDGVGIVHASKIMGLPLQERVTGIDFLYNALEWISMSRGKPYFLGGKPGVAEMAAANMMKKYPGLNIVGFRDGYFTEEDEAGIVEEINASGADFLCVALGSPKQERFIYRNRGALEVKVAIGVGGSFDVMAGALKRAPEFYRKHGLEWLFRLKQQPSRIKRMVVLPLFLIKVLLNSRRG
ncbi:MAG: WecB/TagA/CpsF family glycosyltransferase [Clostridiales Family XIII bacterium]|jgi:N-acetylglucosaminyldiphosphoundecaprenol N-acetyl-beta-D-mannosaminyltransferase|nr:WecB/TagA/CpsF family glycosyltransferase [Clostridiales Family XIII bacterium]